MNRKINTNSEDQSRLKTLVSEITKEQQKIDRHEGNVVACQLRIANCLAQLRVEAKKTWAKQLKAMGMSPRVASRFLTIARHWPAEIGLNESDLLPRLPTDLLKLEWLCRVPQDQLGDLLTNLDCKKATRSQVIAAVREALGEDPPPQAEPDAEKFVQRLIVKLMNSVERLGDKFHQPEQQDHVRGLLAAGLQQVQDALQAPVVLPKDP
jgi:hypothetical protein